MIRRLLLLYLLIGGLLAETLPPRRIASYSPGATHTIIALGASDQLVAVTRWCPLPSTHPAQRTCDAFNPDLEALLKAKPDLVILPRLANPLWAERCERAGLRVLLLSAESPQAITNDLNLIAQALGQEAKAAQWDRELTVIPTKQPQTLVVIWDGMMAGPDAYTALPLRRAGFKSPLKEGSWVKLDWELLVAAKPDAILWVKSEPTNSPIVTSVKYRDEMSKIPAVQGLKSVKSGNIFETTSGSDWLLGAGALQTAQKLAELSQTLK